MPDFVESTKEVSRGGFQGIKKIRGLQVDLNLIDPPESWDTEKTQMQCSLEDAAILEMFPGEEEFELKDNKFSCLWSYSLTREAVNTGKRPFAGCPWIRCGVASAEAMGKKPSDFTGQYVTLEKIKTLLFEPYEIDPVTKKPLLDEEGNKIKTQVWAENSFCYVSDETADSANIKEYIRDLVTGLNEKATLRKLLVDTRAKQYPSYKDALNNGTLAGELELELVDGKFTKPEEGEATQDEASSS